MLENIKTRLKCYILIIIGQLIMLTLEQQLLSQIKQLPIIKQSEVLDFAQFLVKQQQPNEMITKPVPKRLGLLKGQLEVADDFDDPLPDEMLALFYAEK
jgi:hypothetical protein